jgi:hypothetical protein
MGMLTYFVHKVRQRVEFVSDKTAYTILIECCYCDFIILNVHAPDQDKRDDTKTRRPDLDTGSDHTPW